MKEKSISIETVQRETETFLSWVEERNPGGFIKRETTNLRGILEACLNSETFEETVAEAIKHIRHWIREWWNPNVVGRTFVNHRKKSNRAEVIEKFPDILKRYLEVVSNASLAELSEEQNSVFLEIRERIRSSIEKLQPETSAVLEAEARQAKEQERKLRNRIRMQSKNKARKR